MYISNHLTSQLASERQRDLRAGGVPRARIEPPGSRPVRAARLDGLRTVGGWRARLRLARRAERVGC